MTRSSHNTPPSQGYLQSEEWLRIVEEHGGVPTAQEWAALDMLLNQDSLVLPTSRSTRLAEARLLEILEETEPSPPSRANTLGNLRFPKIFSSFAVLSTVLFLGLLVGYQYQYPTGSEQNTSVTGHTAWSGQLQQEGTGGLDQAIESFESPAIAWGFAEPPLFAFQDHDELSHELDLGHIHSEVYLAELDHLLGNLLADS